MIAREQIFGVNSAVKQDYTTEDVAESMDHLENSAIANN